MSKLKNHAIHSCQNVVQKKKIIVFSETSNIFAISHHINQSIKKNWFINFLFDRTSGNDAERSRSPFEVITSENVEKRYGVGQSKIWSA